MIFVRIENGLEYMFVILVIYFLLRFVDDVFLVLSVII